MVAGVMVAMSGVALAERTGEELYNTKCMACHAAAVAGAPKTGDAAAWGPRVAMGIDALVASAKKGKNAMPPMGTCMDCSDAELKAAIEFMLPK
jgi:cytochrome c5